jgi:hypothetical protein
MIDGDYNTESEEEFFENFSGWELTNEDLEEVLLSARKDGDLRLRRLVKQSQYFEFLLRKLIYFTDNNDHDGRANMLDLARVALRTKAEEKS